MQYSAMSDFVVMRKGAIMAIASPNVTSIAIGKPIGAEELGGWKHSPAYRVWPTWR